MTTDSPSTATTPATLRSHDPAPRPTQLGDWVVLAPISNHAKLLYWLLMAHSRDDDTRSTTPPPVLTNQTLVELLTISLDELATANEELIAIGALEIHDQGHRNVVYDACPTDYAGARTLREFYRAKTNGAEPH